MGIFPFPKLRCIIASGRAKLAFGIVVLTASSILFTALIAVAQTPIDNRSQAGAPVAPATPQANAQAEAQRLAALILVKNALLAVNQGNLTGNYTVLRDLSSPGFREKNSAADLAAIFQNIRQQKIDLSVLAVMDPVLGEPQLRADGQLALTGYFSSQQLRINFQLLFLKANNGGWLIHGVSLNAVPEMAAAAPAVQR
jgi:hypothetical protein